MKVILLKDCKEGKANTIVEITDGYAKNFLIPKGFALPLNNTTKKMLEKKLNELSYIEHENRAQALKLKKQLEEITLNFSLDANIDANQNLNVHGSVSTKNIETELNKLNIQIPKKSLEKVKLISEGNHQILIKLYKDISAKINVKISIKSQK